MATKSVIIKQIEIQNYRVFRDATIDLTPKAGKNISVIEAPNGFGKSNIFNAINWCFFGNEPHLREDSTGLPLCNTAALKEAKANQVLEVRVAMLIETPSGEKKVERKQAFHKTGARPYAGEATFSVLEKVGNQWKPLVNPNYAVSRVIPEEMAHFFFIDGEKLRELFERVDPEMIKQSIFELSQVNLLQNAIDHLESFKGVVRRESGADTDQTIAMAEEQLGYITKQLDDFKKQMAQAQEERQRAIANKKKLDEQLAGLDQKDVNRLAKERADCEEAIESDSEDKIRIEEELHEHIVANYATLLLQPTIDASLLFLGALQKKHKLPPDFKTTFIQRLLKEGQCICGVDLSLDKNAQHKGALQSLLTVSKEEAASEQAVTLLYRLESMRNSPQKVLEKTAALERRLADCESKIAERQRRLKDINTRLLNTDVDRVKIIQGQRDQLESQIRQADGRMGQMQASISINTNKKNEAEKLLRRVMAKQERFKVAEEKMSACDQARGLLEGIKDKLMQEIREDAERHTQDNFRHMVSAKNFDPPRITPDYELIVMKDGYNAVRQLSAAETLCMGYSFMAALRHTSGFLAPIVIDTPLAKIALQYRRNVASWLLKALPDAQIMLLVTDTEYTQDFRDAIRSSVGVEYQIEHQQKAGYSEVVPYAR